MAFNGRRYRDVGRIVEGSGHHMTGWPDLSLIVRSWSRVGGVACRAAASLCMTIRGRILVAFLVMSVITAALGGYATMGIRNAGVLVDKTFDESLMSINYARAAATDFAVDARGLRAALDRHRSDDARRARQRDRQARRVAVGRSRDRGRNVRNRCAPRAPPRTCSARSTPGKTSASACSTARRARRELGRRSTIMPARSTTRSICW